MNSLLSWDNILNKGYQLDLCPLLYFIITKALPGSNGQIPETGKKQVLRRDSVSGEIVPEYMLMELKNIYKNNLKRNIVILEELKRVVQELKKQDIQVVVLKGGLLAEHVYENIACRPMGDLDLLVKDGDRGKCHQILNGMGYISLLDDHTANMMHQTFSKKTMKEHINVDIHYRLVKEFLITDFNLEEIWTYSNLPLEYEIVYLSWHTIRHGIVRLIWLCDIAEIIRNNRGLIQWSIAKNKSIDFNVEKQFAFITYLTNILLLPLFPENGKYPFHYPLRHFSESLFLKIQEKMLKRKDESNLRYLLTMLLIKARDLHKFIPQYMKYRST